MKLEKEETGGELSEATTIRERILTFTAGFRCQTLHYQLAWVVRIIGWLVLIGVAAYGIICIIAEKI